MSHDLASQVLPKKRSGSFIERVITAGGVDPDPDSDTDIDPDGK